MYVPRSVLLAIALFLAAASGWLVHGLFTEVKTWPPRELIAPTSTNDGMTVSAGGSPTSTGEQRRARGASPQVPAANRGKTAPAVGSNPAPAQASQESSEGEHPVNFVINIGGKLFLAREGAVMLVGDNGHLNANTGDVASGGAVGVAVTNSSIGAGGGSSPRQSTPTAEPGVAPSTAKRVKVTEQASQVQPSGALSAGPPPGSFDPGGTGWLANPIDAVGDFLSALDERLARNWISAARKVGAPASKIGR